MFRTQFSQPTIPAGNGGHAAPARTGLSSPTSPPDARLQAWLAQGVEAERCGRTGDAYQAYTAICQQDPSHRGALLGLTRLAAPSGQYGDLLHRLGWQIHRTPWDFEAIDLLLECDPSSVAKLVPAVLRTRASLPGPPRRALSLLETAHSQDRSLHHRLAQTPAVTQAVAQQHAAWSDAEFRRSMLLETVRIGPAQMPRLWQLVVEAGRRLGMPPPECYVKSNRELNAFAGGALDCFLCLTTGLIDALTDEELLFVIGHELGHIAHQHVLFYQVASEIARGCFRSASQSAQVAAAFAGWGGVVGGIGSLLASASALSKAQEGQAVITTALRWQQYSEFSADRAGVVACRSVDTAVSALTKVAELAPSLSRHSRFGGDFNLEAFLEQYDEAAQRFAHVTPAEDYLRSHPYMAHRIRSLQAWRLSWGYHCLLAPAGGGSIGSQSLGEFIL